MSYPILMSILVLYCSRVRGSGRRATWGEGGVALAVHRQHHHHLHLSAVLHWGRLHHLRTQRALVPKTSLLRYSIR